MNTYCFKNVIVTGVVLGSDGKKMSKSAGNYPDPKKVLEQHGGDALRLYLMGSLVMAGEDINVSEEEIREQTKKILIPLWNSYRFLVTFARFHQWLPSDSENNAQEILDLWIESRFWSLVKKFSSNLDKYNIPKAVGLISEFVDDLSKWYIRRSRERFRKGDKQALATLWQVLVVFSKAVAPVTPFLSEEIFKNLTNGKSVHLEDYPKANLKKIDRLLEEKMAQVRKICELGHAARKEVKIKVRQPLKAIKLLSNRAIKLDVELVQLIKDELNVKEVRIKVSKSQSDKEIKVELDTKITPQLRAEGEVRELIRQIQDLRKKAGCRLDERITVILPQIPQDKQLVNQLQKAALAKKLKKGEKLAIVRK